VVLKPQTFTIEYPQAGLVRIATLGDATNADNVSVEIKVTRVDELSPKPKAQITEILTDGDIHIYALTIGPDMMSLNIKLNWKNDWSMYPSHDISMNLFDPSGNFDFDGEEFRVSGETLRIPEVIHVENPLPGTWTLHVDGFLMHGFSDEYSLLITDQDNKPIPSNRL